jgi:ketosteroid isomerase-like protein
MDEQEIVELVQTYERAVNDGDRDRVLSLFAESPTFYDPVAHEPEMNELATETPAGMQPAFEGRAAIREFLSRIGDLHPGLEYTVDWVVPDPGRPGAMFEWHGRSQRGSEELHIRAVDVFELTSEGKIATVRGYIANPDTFRWD